VWGVYRSSEREGEGEGKDLDGFVGMDRWFVLQQPWRLRLELEVSDEHVEGGFILVF